MAAILRKAGFEHLESLRRFSLRFVETPSIVDKILGNVWICHMDLEKIPDEDDKDDCNYFQLYMIVKEKADEVQAFGDTTQFNFDTFGLFDKIYKHFGGCITKYIFTECNIFYNWGINSFEPIINVVHVHKQIRDYAKSIKKQKVAPKFSKSRFAFTSPKKKLDCFKNLSDIPKRNNLNADEEEDKKQKWTKKKKKKRKEINFNSERIQKIYKKCSLPTRGISQNVNDPTQERFSLNKILYDMKQRPRWPKNHILQKNSAEELLKYIVDKKIKSGTDMKNYLMDDIKNWNELKKVLKYFLKEHLQIEKNNGYGRILQHHLKTSKDFTPTDGNKLTIIPKAVVASYILDILRRVFPVDFFGGKPIRKKYCSEIIKILNGSKNESFIWNSIIRHFSSRKNEIKWCKEIKDDFSRDRMILKVSKWLVIDYVFVILKNNFFVSETNSSNYGLKFYRKKDMESVSFFALNDLLYYRKLSLLKSSEVDFFTIERKWVDTGNIEENDLRKKSKTFMVKQTEYKQPVADVRFLPKNDTSSEVRLITNIPTKNVSKAKDEKRKRLLNIFEKRLRLRNSMLRKVKLFLEFLVDKVGTGIKTLPSNPQLEIAWTKCIYLKQNFGKLYFVKADIADAFGSVLHHKLKEILDTISAENCEDFLQLKEIREWKFFKTSLKLKTRQSFTNRASENAVAIDRNDYIKDKKKQGKYFTTELLSVLEQIIFNQRLRIKNKIYKLKQGLAQGAAGKFSPLLNELYYSVMDKTYFIEFLSAEDSLLLRGVDDYLLITSDLERAKKFFDVVYNGISDFNASFNKGKLLTNINEDLKIVPYLGLLFNVDDMSVNPNYSKYESSNLLTTMLLTDSSGDIHFKKYRFLERRARFVTCLKLQPILLNKLFNDLRTVRRIVFYACLMQANRILVLVKYLFEFEEKNDVKIFDAMFKSLNNVTNLIRRVNDSVSVEEVRWFFCYGMLKIFQKFSGQFQDLLDLIKRQLFFSENWFLKTGQEMILEYMKQDIDYYKNCNGIKSVFKNLASSKSLK